MVSKERVYESPRFYNETKWSESRRLRCYLLRRYYGVIWDFPENKELQNISRNIYENGGIVSSVCHGAAGLFHITLSNGDRLISGKKVTGFSNEEEKLAELDQFVPFLTEDELIKMEDFTKKPRNRGKLML